MKATPDVFDLVVIGGGINGAGIAYDAVGRGLRVLLCEQYDFASSTSSQSSKLIHGGIRYLEYYEFRLVREALREREVLLQMAPHIVRPMRFVMPHKPHLRPHWMMRAGLFLYDHLSKRNRLPASRFLDMNQQPQLSAALKLSHPKAYEYADCVVDDSRLVMENLISARAKGATICNYTRCLRLQPVKAADSTQTLWQVTLQPMDPLTRQPLGEPYQVQTRSVVNATGPWAQQFLERSCQSRSPYRIRWVRGSHIVVPRLHDDPRAILLQNPDKRVVFVIPWLNDYSLVGTTDCEHTGDLSTVEISQAETTYLLEVIADNFQHPITVDQIVFSFSGVRPLCDDESDDPASITRDYTIARAKDTAAPLLTVFGGKLTTYRKLAESVLQQLAEDFPNMGAPWTAGSVLHGALDMPNPQDWEDQLVRQNSAIPERTLRRWCQTYGRHTYDILNEVINDGLGQEITPDLFEAEARYLMRQEWAKTPIDILWHRTKLQVLASQTQQAALGAWMAKANHA